MKHPKGRPTTRPRRPFVLARAVRALPVIARAASAGTCTAPTSPTPERPTRIGPAGRAAAVRLRLIDEVARLRNAIALTRRLLREADAAALAKASAGRERSCPADESGQSGTDASADTPGDTLPFRPRG